MASGGIDDGLKAAKALAMGARIAGTARPVLQAFLSHGEDGALEFLETLIAGVRMTLALNGVRTTQQLQSRPCVIGSDLVIGYRWLRFQPWEPSSDRLENSWFLYRLDLVERHRELADRFSLTDEELAILKDGSSLDPARADKMVENCVGVFGLPIGLGLNFIVNERDYVVPMVVEEPSVVAAVSNMAKTVRLNGGFTADADQGIMIAQVQVVDVKDHQRAVQDLKAAEPQLVALANSKNPNMVARVGRAWHRTPIVYGALRHACRSSPR